MYINCKNQKKRSKKFYCSYNNSSGHYRREGRTIFYLEMVLVLRQWKIASKSIGVEHIIILRLVRLSYKRQCRVNET
jgi:hypothetical protein